MKGEGARESHLSSDPSSILQTNSVQISYAGGSYTISKINKAVTLIPTHCQFFEITFKG